MTKFNETEVVIKRWDDNHSWTCDICAKNVGRVYVRTPCAGNLFCDECAFETIKKMTEMIKFPEKNDVNVVIDVDPEAI